MKYKEVIKLGGLLRTKTQIEKMSYAKILNQQQAIYDEAKRLKRLAGEAISDETSYSSAVELSHFQKYRAQLNEAANRKFATAESFDLAVQSARTHLQHALQRELAWAKTINSLENKARQQRNTKEERQSEQSILAKFSQQTHY
jgi:biopolymer transport protein ExbB/TolQ